jgi:hypothetical protein
LEVISDEAMSLVLLINMYDSGSDS